MDYSTVKEKLELCGEILVVMESGQEFELHRGDVTWHDGTEHFSFDTGTEKFHVDGTAVESIEIHRSHRVSKA